MKINKYENKSQPLAPVRVFYNRILKNLLVAAIVLSVCLLIGIFGYHFIANAIWIDAVHNSAMILSGMGPVVEMKNFSGKVFSSCYALFSGVVFITNIGFILAPAAHRLFHKLHMDDDEHEERRRSRDQ
jgi:hypothetical protein